MLASTQDGAGKLQCWACKATICKTDIFCDACAVIQPPLAIDHFTRLGLPQQFSVDEQALERAYFDWQRKLHPDRFARKPERERHLSLQQSMAVNEAYELLKNPLKRAQYLLHLNGVEVNSEHDTVKPEHALLVEIMDYREVLMEAASIQEVQQLQQRLEQDKQAVLAKLAAVLDNKQWEAAAHLAMRLNYVTKLLADVRLQQMKVQ